MKNFVLIVVLCTLSSCAGIPFAGKIDGIFGGEKVDLDVEPVVASPPKVDQPKVTPQ